MTNDDIWAAGLLSAFGSFTVVKTVNAKKTVRLTVRTTVHTQAIERLADIAGANTFYGEAQGIGAKPGVQFAQVVLTGEPLHEFMQRVWKELSPQRKRQYIRARSEAATGK